MSMKLEDRLARREQWQPEICSVAKVLDLLSTKTAFLALRECFWGTARFEDFVDRIGASAPAVSRALKQLETAGVVERVPYREPGSRVRDEYRLTTAGEDLLPVLMALTQWGDKYLQNGSAPLGFVDSRTGRPVRVCVTSRGDVNEPTSSDIEIRARFTDGQQG
ncbi:helix-turn-helix domain-containing protein [Mycobacterium sp. M26]|uniref:winged helix-turn-helix transcriptional regulator n=1 Tax=Mycobacterium sp. M26 TaxID=1762962 RepID=UPI0009E92AE6|nr:helix-turn-helix domain-containing protein [Mycobacterium sp. M26]